MAELWIRGAVSSDETEDSDVKRLLRIAEVADVLRVSTARAYELARKGVIPAVRLGRQVRVDSERLEKWIESGGSADESVSARSSPRHGLDMERTW